MFNTGLAVRAMVVLAGLMLSSAARSATPVDDEGGADGPNACQADIHRLCDRFFPDEKLVATCLVERRADLSLPCARALAAPKDDEEPD